MYTPVPGHGSVSAASSGLVWLFMEHDCSMFCRLFYSRCLPWNQSECRQYSHLVYGPSISPVSVSSLIWLCFLTEQKCVTIPCCFSADSRSVTLHWYLLISVSSCSLVWNTINRTSNLLVPCLITDNRTSNLLVPCTVVQSPWSPSRHRSFLHSSLSAEHTLAAAPDTPESADGNEAPSPHAHTP